MLYRAEYYLKFQDRDSDTWRKWSGPVFGSGTSVVVGTAKPQPYYCQLLSRLTTFRGWLVSVEIRGGRGEIHVTIDFNHLLTRKQASAVHHIY